MNIYAIGRADSTISLLSDEEIPFGPNVKVVDKIIDALVKVHPAHQAPGLLCVFSRDEMNRLEEIGDPLWFVDTNCYDSRYISRQAATAAAILYFTMPLVKKMVGITSYQIAKISESLAARMEKNKDMSRLGLVINDPWFFFDQLFIVLRNIPT